MIVPASDASRPLKVRITSAGLPAGLELFTPGSTLRWGRCEFLVNPVGDHESDFWIVFGNAFPRETGRVARHNTLFIAAEPPAKKVYPRGFYRQFQHIVDSHQQSRHPRVHVGALGLCWMVGLSWAQQRYTLGYDALKQLTPPAKQNRVSVICSTTAQTAGQRQRLKFLAALREHLGEDLVVFGKGFQAVDDKLEAVLPYRFHLVLENSRSPHYWTEKLTDAYLGWAFPFYVGCPNLSDYFATDSFLPLNMSDVSDAVRIIRSKLVQPAHPEELVTLKTAREKVLDVYNPFARFSYWAELLYREGEKETLTLRSEKAFRFIRGWFYRLQHRNFIRG